MRFSISAEAAIAQLDSVRAKMGALSPSELTRLELDKRVRETTDLHELDSGPPGTRLRVNGNAVFVYLAHGNQSLSTWWDVRVHFMRCATLMQMRERNQAHRYAITRIRTGEFPVRAGPNGRAARFALSVCRSCLLASDWPGYATLPETEQKAMARSFDYAAYLDGDDARVRRHHQRKLSPSRVQQFLWRAPSQEAARARLLAPLPRPYEE